MGGMDEEQHYDKFSVDNDFEGGQFIGGEFFYQSKREKRQQTKEDQIYGVFADSSDDERPRKREKADYSKPVSFISKGQVINKPEEQQEKDKEEDADDRAPGLGLGARPSFATLGPSSGAGLGAGGGLGFTPAQSGGQQAADDDEQEVLPTAFGARIKAKAAQRRQQEEKEQKKEKQREATKASDPHIGSFEKHTKGIGMKLLQKMGYKPGEGLGKDRQGIAKPVEAKLRPKGMGMGFGSRHHEEEEEAPKTAVQGPMSASQAAQQAAGAGGGKLWKKRNAEARVRREYKTATEVLAEAPAKPLAAQPILDMRGPQARLITNLEHLNAQEETAAGSRVPMPELQHNLQLLVDLAEADIQKLDARLRHEQDTATLLGREKTRLEEEAARQEEQLQRLAHVMNEVARCEAHSSEQAQGGQGTGGLSLAAVEAVYSGLARLYREEYIMYNLAAAALSHALPRMVALMQGWAPLAEPRRGVPEFAQWRPLLEPQGGSGGSGGAASGLFGAGGGLDAGDVAGQDPYTLLITEVVLPAVRAAFTAWEPRDPEPPLAWLELWEPLLPRAVLTHVLESLVMPRLRRAVGEWEPRQETVPIHAWLHPWLPYLGDALEELYPGIRHKLSVALQAWHPSDGSALLLLRPWLRVFSAQDWEALLLRSILPKLAAALQQLAINPAAQEMAPFQWVMAWADVLPAQHMAALLDTHFFPKWHQVLHFWLSHSPNYDEVTRWYLGWKACFPAGLLDHERLRRQFNAALDMMNTAVDGHVMPPPGTAGSTAGAGAAAGGPASAYASRWATGEDMSGEAAQPPLPKPSAAAVGAGGSEPSLKELVQRFAEENSIQFMPKFGRYQDGLQVYSFGSTSVVLDNTHSVIRALMRDRWAPVTLETLLQQALQGKSK